MWLLNAKTYELEYFPSETDRPRYAILSHCWDKEEITFADIRTRPLLRTRRKSGWRKVKQACAAAREHKVGGAAIQWLWDDTCCIDKSSSAELSEALNSMYSWYRDAWICFAYLSDVPSGQDPEMEGSAFRSSRWFTRGWTLQELIAAKPWMVFLSGDWARIGTCEELAPVIEDITHIDRKLLLSRGPERSNIMRGMSIAARMAWASGRETTRAEDRAYSLMGIFDVHMPILYGEGGERAFRRLQLEIIQQSTDQTVFAYGTVVHRLPKSPPPFSPNLRRWEEMRTSNLLAPSPDAFVTSAMFETIPIEDVPPLLHLHAVKEPHYHQTNRGIRIELPLASLDPAKGVFWALLAVRPEPGSEALIGLLLKRPHEGSDTFCRLAKYEVKVDNPDVVKGRWSQSLKYHLLMDTSSVRSVDFSLRSEDDSPLSLGLEWQLKTVYISM